jgi:maleylacetate reductase
MGSSFTHVTAAQNAHFGSGNARDALHAEVQARAAARIMLIAGGRSAADARRLLDGLPVTLIWDEVAQHVPVETARRARAAAAAERIDLIVCVGGGSTIGMGKAVALTEHIPIVAVPTTYAGSEATDVWGVTENARKTTGNDPAVLPVAVVYDAELTAGLDADTAIASGLNAIAHCVDGFWAPRADPINAALGGEGLRALADGVQAIATETDPSDGRAMTQFGAYLAGVAFSSAGSGLHHKICHALGGTFGLPHAQTHAIVLPHVAAFNIPAAPDAARRIAAALGTEDAVLGVRDLYHRVRAPRALRDVGFREEDIPVAVEIVLPTVPASNPRPVDAASLTRLLTDAWAGSLPS